MYPLHKNFSMGHSVNFHIFFLIAYSYLFFQKVQEHYKLELSIFLLHLRSLFCLFISLALFLCISLEHEMQVYTHIAYVGFLKTLLCTWIFSLHLPTYILPRTYVNYNVRLPLNNFSVGYFFSALYSYVFSRARHTISHFLPHSCVYVRGPMPKVVMY